MSEVPSTKTMRREEYSTDHFMVRCQLRFRLILPRRKTPARANTTKLNVSKLAVDKYQHRLAAAFSSTLGDTPLLDY